jgi:hypothetical protein
LKQVFIENVSFLQFNKFSFNDSMKKSLSAKHFDALFTEATDRLREVRVGDPTSHASTVHAIATAKDITVDTLTSLNGNPHFARVLTFLQSQEDGANDVLLERDATAQYNRVLAASLKVMLRETMFAKSTTQRDAYMSRVHDWYNEKVDAASVTVPSQRSRSGVRPESNDDDDFAVASYDDIPVDFENPEDTELNGSPERLRERQARAARYATKGPKWKQEQQRLRPKSATTNVFLAGTAAGQEYDASVSQARSSTSRPSSVLASRPASAAASAARRQGRNGRGSSASSRRPATASSGAQRDGVVITGRLNQGGFRVRNLFASQRHRVQSHVLSRAEKRKKLHDIQRAEQLHRADVDESLRSHQHLLKEKTTITRSRVSPATAGMDKQRPSSAAPTSGGRNARAGSAPRRPASASSSVAGNVFKYPQASSSGTAGTATSTSTASAAGGTTKRHSTAVVSLRAARERDQWLEETWLRGRSLDAADERNQKEITAAMQQWAMNRGRIEEEIMRRQESRRYVSRSGRYYATTGSYDTVRQSASSSRVDSSRSGSNGGEGNANAANDSKGGQQQRERPRTAKSAPRAKPIISTPVVVLKKNRGSGNGGSSSNVEGKGTPKKPPMHFKYGPRTVNNDNDNTSGANITSGVRDKETAQPNNVIKRARPSSAAASTTAGRQSLSPYRGNYGTSVVTDSFGVRIDEDNNSRRSNNGGSLMLQSRVIRRGGGGDGGQDVGDASKTAWDSNMEVNDGEIAVLSMSGSVGRIPPPPVPGSIEETEMVEMKRITQIAFGAAIKRDAESRPPPEKTTSKGGKKGKKGKKKKGGKKKGGKKGKKGKSGKGAGKGAAAADAEKEPIAMFLPRPSEQKPPIHRRPMSSTGRRTMREVESIQQAFTRHRMTMPCSQETLEKALSVPEELSYDECIANLPLPGGRFLADPLAAERAALKALYNTGKKKGGKKKGGKKKGGKKKKKKKK